MSAANRSEEVPRDAIDGPHGRVVPPGAASARRWVGPIIWLVVTFGFVLFLVAGSVTVETGLRQGASIRVAAEWDRFLDQLPVVGRPTLLRGVVIGAIVVFVVGSSVALWLALNTGGMTSDRRSNQPDNA